MNLTHRDKEKMIEQLVEITNSTRENAIFLLESNDWSLSETVMNYLENYKSSDERIHKKESNSNLEIRNNSNFKTLDDIYDKESDSEDEAQEKLYSGGEKSYIYLFFYIFFIGIVQFISNIQRLIKIILLRKF